MAYLTCGQCGARTYTSHSGEMIEWLRVLKFSDLTHSATGPPNCGRGLNYCSTVAEPGSYLRWGRCNSGHLWGFGMNRGITDNPIHSDSSRFIKNTAWEECRGNTGLNHNSTVANLGRIVSIRSSTVGHSSTAVMKHNGAVDISCRYLI